MNKEWGMHPANGLYVGLFVIVALLILFPLSENFNPLDWGPFTRNQQCVLNRYYPTDSVYLDNSISLSALCKDYGQCVDPFAISRYQGCFPRRC